MSQRKTMTVTDIQDYVPENEWPSVSTMLDGFGNQTLPASSALTGKVLHLPGDGARPTTCTFHDAHSLTWSRADGGLDQAGAARYKAIEARPGIFIIDFVTGEDLAAENVTIIYDSNTGAVTTAVTSFVNEGGKVRSTTRFSHGNVNGSAPVHLRSTALVGKRIYYRYSDVETYEHIYLNAGTFTWHCLRGGEAGLADTDRCMAFDVAEDLYLFFWTEKVMTVEAVLLIDLREQRSIGRMFGWDEPAAEPVILPFNSRLTVLNTTEYPRDNHKH
ncbi:MoaF C-terminal domain-containing protein [Arthrobacter sp. NPDC057388]|uniref:MoaF C-terminal domain-containing protein n=1 Tax=Arthrobacter sp. NPDC057388 TaxID=3346116 RepID=UPI00363D6451